MAKQRADNGIDYTPRSEKAIRATNQRPMERHVHGVVQRAQRHPIYEVTAAGKCVEWTDARLTAHAVFASVSVLPKQLILVHDGGRRQLLDEVTATNRRPTSPDLMRAAA
jgi:hypothetical protein